MAEKMKLEAFIERMKAGWGFWRPHRVQRIGHALDKIIPPHLRDEEVEVSFHQSSSGCGPSHVYSYRWEVRGVKLPIEGRLAPSESDVVFGFSRGMLPILRNTEDGFVVGYDW